MEQNDKYYIPDLEDLRIGYEMEANIDFFLGFGEDKWEHTTLKGVDEAIVKYYRKGMYRTPYLTKEQIEAEGWEGGVKADKKGYIYSYVYEDRQFPLIIKKLANCPFPDEIVFSGECKSINEFRYICKLLKIN